MYSAATIQDLAMAWRPQIIFAVFGATCFHAVFAGSYARRLNCSRSRCAFACFILMFGLCGMILSYEWFSPHWRQLAKDTGMYQDRQQFQRWASIAVVTLAPLMILALLVVSDSEPRSFQVAMAGSVVITALGALSVISYHSIDELLGRNVIGNVKAWQLSGAIALSMINIGLAAGWVECRSQSL